MTERTAVVWVHRNTSTCSACRRDALYDDSHHYTVPGGPTGRPSEQGCGARFEAIGSARIEIGANRLAQLRPNLPIRKYVPR
ncbi:hypothetical protein ACFVHB_20220 [Kitasatospora sp. NPDC127111]|uniref:hypothetical protein n=1 Tax=Kitasatospora sp. NPDC127111 TaxID=3345363 RepID=UPI003640EDB8